MNFYSVVDQAITLLRQRGRVTYRALKRQFALDDEALEDLKEELMYGQRLAADEDGRVLVWTGDMPMVTEPHASLSPSGQPSPTYEDPSAHAATPAVSPMADAERRQLTVMFCDLVDSTTLSGQLDPEDLRDVVRAYHQVCSAVITRFDGHVAQLLGDGLLVYFGYPQAHEDDAHRAVRTGLGILDAVEDLNTRLKRAKDIELALRLGIHTGLVVVGTMGGAGRQEQLALGETPNIAARIQGLAQPNTVAISDATYHLVQGYFQCQDLGAQTLRGVTESMRVHHVLSESGATSRLDVTQPRGLTPLVGREQEVGLLLERWEQVKAGHGHIVLLTGEAGIGKSRLVQRLKEHVAQEPHVRWECRSAEYAQNTALFPLTDLFQRLLRFQAAETPHEKCGKLAQMLSQYRLPLEESVPLFAPLFSLPLPDHYSPPLTLSPQRQRQKTLEALVAVLLEQAEQQPLLFIVEDLHWTDPSTLEFLNLVIDQTPTASLLVLLTCRPDFHPAWHHRSYLTEVTVNRLSHAQGEQMVTGMTEGRTFPAAVFQQILDKTDGVPLFVEEITKAILESGHLTDVDGHYALAESFRALTIPATLQDALMARLDRLAEGKVVAQLGAVLGRTFASALLRAVAPLDERALWRGLAQLVQAEVLYQRGTPPHATYMFKHALVQDAAYQSLLRSTRQQYHQRTAQVMGERFPDQAETQPELLAHHYTKAGLAAHALPYWHRAGERAAGRSAHMEAIGHFRQALAVLALLPDTAERARQELTLYLTLGPSLIATRGWAAPEVEHTYAQAMTLGQQGKQRSQLFQALWGLASMHVVRAEPAKTWEIGDQLLSQAQQQHGPVFFLAAYQVLGSAAFGLGEFAVAQGHFAQSRVFYDARQHRSHVALFGADYGVFCLTWGSQALWLLGYADQARTQSREVLTLAQELSHPLSQAIALAYAAMLQQFCQDAHAVHALTETMKILCTEHSFIYYLAWAMILQGWALVRQGHDAPGIAQMVHGLAALQDTGAKRSWAYYTALLAEAYGNSGAPREGLRMLADAFEHVQHTGECWWEAELHRLKGELLLQTAGRRRRAPEAPEACFRQALEVARRQQAKSLELRAAMSLSRLWQHQGRRTEAHALLAPIYGWFTEGFDTAHLQEAKTILGALEG